MAQWSRECAVIRGLRVQVPEAGVYPGRVAPARQSNDKES